jgi:quercetin dioxygenase-like cupin family protein
MSDPAPRLRPPAAERLAGPEHLLKLGDALAALRREPRTTGTGAGHGSGHRQVTLLHRGPLRIVLFAFDAGGRLPEHAAPGPVTLQALRGAFRVRTPSGAHRLDTGDLLALDPGVPHDVAAEAEGDLLLTVGMAPPPPGPSPVTD